jgi:hypothetical protein
MKKLLLLSSILLILFNSCSSDDENPNLLGKWYYYKRTEIINGQQEESLHTHECSTKKDYIEFLEGTFNNVIYNNLCNLDLNEAFTDNYIIDGSNLYLDVNEDDAIQITTLNNNTLILEANYEEVDSNGDMISGRTISEFKRN